MRLVPVEYSKAIKNAPAMNFSLYFNKLLPYHDGFSFKSMKKVKGKYKLDTVVETFKPREGEQDGCRKKDDSSYGPAKEHLPKYRQAGTAAGEILKRYHIRQAEYCRAMEKAGWKSFVFHTRLTAPFVSGLGAAHPTETGLILDHTSGMPYIPAAGQKGVLRLAHLINSLKNGDDWLSEEELRERGIVDENMNWLEDDSSRALFGAGGGNDALAGRLNILDAYPLLPPELGEEILNPHYRDYYEGKRGPTEDQSPVPIKFLVVRPGAEFVFRILLRTPFSEAADIQEGKLEKIVHTNLRRSITDIGMGAKTALGFGRFSLVAEQEPAEVETWIAGEIEKKRPWLAYVRKITTVKDWGMFNQVVLNADIPSAWQKKAEVGKAVAAAAGNVWQQKPEKWTTERDAVVGQWLSVSGASWTPLAQLPVGPEKTSPVDKELLAQITGLTGWKEYTQLKTQLKIKIGKLDKECAQALKEKFKTWKLKKSKDRQQKRAFNALGRRLKQFSR